MFNKLKSFSEDVAKSFNEIQQVDPLKKNGDLIERLRNSLRLLSQRTPEIGDLTQPTDDEPATKESRNELPGSPTVLKNTMTKSSSNDVAEKSSGLRNDKALLEETEDTPVSKLASPNALQDIDLEDLPPVVRAKLKKFVKYEEKYPLLLDAYKTEKKKGELILAFEKVMSEVTPVLSISDAGLLVDFLNGLTEKATLLANELRRSVTEASKLARENEELTSKLARSQKSLQAFEENMAKKINAESEYIANVKQLEEKIKALEADVAASVANGTETSASTESGAEIQKLRDELLAKQQALEDANNSFADTKQRLEDKINKTQEAMQKEIDQVVSRAKTEASNYEEKLKAYDLDVAELPSLKLKLKNAETSVLKYEARLAELQASAQSKDQQKEKEILTQDLAASNKTVEELRNESGVLRLEAQDLREQLSELKDVNEAMESTAKKTHGDAESTAVKIKSLEDELKVKSEEAGALSAELENTKHELAQAKVHEPSTLHPDAGVQSSNHKSNTGKKKKGKKNNRSIPAANVSANEEKKTTKEEEQLVKEKLDLIAQVEAVEAEKTALLEEIEHLKQVLVEKKQLISDSTVEIEKNANELTRLKQDLEEKEDLIKRMEREKMDATSVQEDLRSTKKELQEKSEDLEQLRDLLKDLGNELVTAKKNLKDTKTKWQSEHAAEIEELRKKEISLRDLLEKKESGFSEALNEKELELKSLTEKNARVVESNNSEISRLSEELENVQANLNDTKAKLIELQKTASSKEEELSRLKKNMDLLRVEKKRLEERIEELSKFKSADASLKLEIASLQSSISHKDEQIKELKDTQEKMNRDRDDLNSTIATLKATSSDLRATNQRFTDEKTQMMEKQQSAIERANALASEVSNLQVSRQKIGTELEALKLKYEALQRTRASASDEILEYKQQHEELASKAKESQNQIDDLQEELFEAKNLLQERTRESSTLRRILLEAEEEHTIRCNELKSEMRSLSEEQSETEANFQVQMKKRQREIEELKHLCEKYVAKITELEKTCEEVRQKYEPLRNTKHQASFEDLQKQRDLENMVDELRASLQASSKKVKDCENLNGILKKLNEESTLKFERLSKNYKHVTHQYRQIKESQEQKGAAAAMDQETKSAAIKSPETNVAYLKNVLVGFLEHKEQREQLLPVLKMLFQFNPEEERKLMLALR